MLNYLKCLLQLILSPGKGWEDISYEGRDARGLLNKGYIPFIALVALSCLIQMAYSVGGSWIIVVMKVALTFVRYFVSFFISMFILGLTVTDYVDGNYNEKRTTTFVVYTLGLVAMLTLLANALPFDIGIIYFLPIYIAIIIWKSARYMAVKSDKTFLFVLLSAASIMLPPYLIGWLFDKIL